MTFIGLYTNVFVKNILNSTISTKKKKKKYIVSSLFYNADSKTRK